MSDGVLEKIHTYPLSVARRLFALRHTARISEECGNLSLAQSIRRAISFDQRTIQLDALRKEYARLARSGHPALERLIQLTYEDIKAHSQEGHLHFVAIVEQILETYFGQSTGHRQAREALLAPIHSQLERVEIYASRRSQCYLPPSGGALDPRYILLK